MATTTFTTWANLRDALLDKLAARDFSKSSATVAGNEIRWSTVDEFLRLLEYAKGQAALESGQASLRVYARQGGRG